MKPSYLYNGNSDTGKTVPLYWQGTQDRISKGLYKTAYVEKNIGTGFVSHGLKWICNNIAYEWKIIVVMVFTNLEYL